MKKTTLICMLIFSIFFSINNFAQSTALYDISFQSTWNSSDHGTLPSNAHWSNLVGTNHNGSVTFLAIGQPASPGIEDVAEIGDNSTFNSEVQAAINMGNAEQWFNEPFAPYAAISSATLSNITVSEDFPLVSLAAMIAPSPDWMIAVNSLNLWDTDMEKWKESFTVDLFPYDAGTEDGFGYSGSNPSTNPHGVITNIAGATGYPFNSEKVGTLTITFKSSTLSNTNFKRSETAKIYPNPSNTGNITIANANSIKNIEIYDVLGKAVKTLKFNSTEQNRKVDVSSLKIGVYIVRLTDNFEAITSKKLVID